MNGAMLEPIVRALVAETARCSDKLVVLKNYEWLPQANRGRDLDLLVLPGTEAQWCRILDCIAQRLGLCRMPGPRYYHAQAHVLEGPDRGPLQIDLISRFHWRGVDWMSPQRVWANAVPFREGIWIPAPADHCVFTFCQSYLHGGLVPDRHVPQMVAEARQYGHEVRARLAGIFGPGLATRILGDLQHERIDALRATALRYRLIVLARGLVRHPLKTILTALVGYWMEWQITVEQAELSRRAKAAPGPIPAGQAVVVPRSPADRAGHREEERPSEPRDPTTVRGAREWERGLVARQTSG